MGYQNIEDEEEAEEGARLWWNHQGRVGPHWWRWWEVIEEKAGDRRIHHWWECSRAGVRETHLRHHWALILKGRRELGHGASPRYPKKKRCQCCVVMWPLLSSPFFRAASVLSTTYVDLTVPLTCDTVNWKQTPALPCSWIALIPLIFFSPFVFLQFPQLRDNMHVCASLFPEPAFPPKLFLVSSRGNRFLTARLEWTLHISQWSRSLNSLTGIEPMGTRGIILSCSYHVVTHRQVADFSLASLTVDLCFYILCGKVLWGLARRWCSQKWTLLSLFDLGWCFLLPYISFQVTVLCISGFLLLKLKWSWCKEKEPSACYSWIVGTNSITCPSTAVSLSYTDSNDGPFI